MLPLPVTIGPDGICTKIVLEGIDFDLSYFLKFVYQNGRSCHGAGNGHEYVPLQLLVCAGVSQRFT